MKKEKTPKASKPKPKPSQGISKPLVYGPRVNPTGKKNPPE